MLGTRLFQHGAYIEVTRHDAMNTFIAKLSGKLHEARISNVNYELGKVKESIIHESSSYVESIISRSESIRFSQIFSSKRASKENENR